MLHTVLALVRRWFNQDTARTNAAQAAVRLQHQRRQRHDVDAYLAAHHRPPGRNNPVTTTEAVHARRRRRAPH